MRDLIVKGEFRRDGKIKYTTYFGHYPIVNGQKGFFVTEKKESGETEFVGFGNEKKYFEDKYKDQYDSIFINIL